jgi:cation:H+ antiporter
MSGLSGHANLSLGNAYGSCSFNIAVILGVAALVRPVAARARVPIVAGALLAGVTLFSWALLRDGVCSRADAVVLLASFAVVMPLYCLYDQKTSAPPPSGAEASSVPAPPLASAFAKVAVGLAVLVGSSHFLVWGAVDFAKFLGVSDLVVGLTVVAVGTSLPELASALASARRNEHEFVLGNIVGSNLFNMLGVVGLAMVFPSRTTFSPYILTRDLPVVFFLSLSIAFFGANLRHPSRPGTIRRWEGGAWMAFFVLYSVLMFLQETGWTSKS